MVIITTHTAVYTPLTRSSVSSNQIVLFTVNTPITRYSSFSLLVCSSPKNKSHNSSSFLRHQSLAISPNTGRDLAVGKWCNKTEDQEFSPEMPFQKEKNTKDFCPRFLTLSGKTKQNMYIYGFFLSSCGILLRFC